MLDLIKGVEIPNSDKLEEGYNIKENCITMNVNYYKIRRLINDFININKEEKMFLFIEVPTNLEDEEVEENIIKELHNDVYYLDYLSNTDLKSILDVYDDILINDGLVNFGIGTFSGDEIGKYKYNIMNINTSEEKLYMYENMLKNNNIYFNADLITAYDLINKNNPGISNSYKSNGISIYDVIDELKRQGLYKSQKISNKKDVAVNTFELSNVDMRAIELGDSLYINNKGAKYYNEGKYELAIEYYKIASSMGNIHAVSNLGYCYMYGRSVEKNMSLALTYFKIAAQKNDVDALYKLGDIYKNGYGVDTDYELALYYYDKALYIIETDDNIDIYDYPSVYLSLAKEYMPKGLKHTNIERAYRYLKIARDGYEILISDEAASYYKNAYESTLKLLDEDIFSELKREDEEECAFEDDEFDLNEVIDF